jgi:hypothetical protein
MNPIQPCCQGQARSEVVGQTAEQAAMAGMMPHGFGIQPAAECCVVEHNFARGFLSLVWKIINKETIKYNGSLKFFADELIFEINLFTK